MKLWVFILPVLSGLIAGCNEEKLPKPDAGDPTFEVKGVIDGKSRSIQAGKAEYFMHTYFTSDSNNQYYLTGQFGNPKCRNCPKSLKIQIPSYRNAKGELNLEEALREGERSYYQPVKGRKVSFNAISNKDGAAKKFTWSFGDDRSSVKKAPTHFYPSSSRDTFTTTLRINYNNGACVARTSRKISLEENACRVNYQVKHVNQTEIVFESLVRNIDRPVRYRWFKENTLISKVAHPTFDFLKPGSYKVCLKASGASGCSTQRCQEVEVFADGCNANFNYMVSDDTARVDLSYVNISWRDEQGKVYITGKHEQPDRSYFRILKAKPYQENRRGQPTYKLEVEFDCMVYAADDSKLRLKAFKGTIGVAYPENGR